MVVDYKNILLELGSVSSEFSFILRAIELSKAYEQNISHDLHSDLLMIAFNQYKKNKILKINNEIGRYSEKEIYKILREIGYEYSLSIVRCLGLITLKILKKFFSGVYLDEGQLVQIKKDLRTSPVVFMPTHRSYGDFILISFICFKYDISMPCVAAGKDFLSMWLINKMLRKSKAFFMRRKFSNDPFYKNIFKEYMKVLVSYGDSPIEFFIEGTRSRTGKALKPKFGILSMIVDAYISGNIPDLKFIPINISYDRILEEWSFAQELVGIPKQRESTVGLIRGLKLMSGNYGNVFINFGGTLSIRDYFNDVEDFRFMSTEIHERSIRKLAFSIVNIQQNLQTFGCFSLLALVMNSALVRTRTPIVTLRKAVYQFQWLLELYKYFGAYVFMEGEIEEAIKESINNHPSLVELNEENSIHLKLYNKQNISSFPSNSLYQEHCLMYVPFMMLQIYVNQSLSLFVRGSIMVIILRALEKGNKLEQNSLFENYMYLCMLLKNEFILCDESMKEFSTYIIHLKNLGIIKTDGSSAELQPSNHLIEFFLDLIYPFISGIHSICLFLKGLVKVILKRDRNDLIKMVKFHIEGQVREGLVPYHYCASIDFISNTYNSLLEMGVFIQCKTKNCLTIDEKAIEEVINFLGVLVRKSGFQSYFKLHTKL